MSRVAVVTGSNKGIGYEIVRALCKQFDGAVYLTARDKGRGEEAIQKLRAEGLKPRFHQLDIVDKCSIDTLAKYLRETYGGLDVLVNNAGIAYIFQRSTLSEAGQAEVTMATNYWGTVNVCKALFPLLRPGARVVHMSTMISGQAYQGCSDVVKQRLDACTTVDQVGACMNNFVGCVKTGNLAGWARSDYGCSKIGVSLITPMQQRDMDKVNSDIVINVCHPGYVDTDMTNHSGHKTAEQGADTPVYLALLPPNTDIRGQYVTERTVKNWRD